MQAHLGGYRDEPVREAEGRDPHRWGEDLSEPSAWDASAGAHRVEADAARRDQALPEDAGVGKWADPAPDGPEPAAWFPQATPTQQEQPVAAEALYKQASDQFAAQSCAAQAESERPQPAEPVDALPRREEEPLVVQEL